MEKRFVKLGDKYYVVEMSTDKGLTLVPATDKDIVDEQFEAAAFLNADVNKIGEDNFLQQIIDSTKNEMVTALKQGLKKTVLRTLGFSDSWNRGWEVDHCNGRMSEVSNYISVTLKQVLRSVTEEELGISEKERKELIAAMKKDILDQYSRKMRDSVWGAVQKMAQEDVQRIAEDLLKKRSEQVGAIVLEKLFESVKKP